MGFPLPVGLPMPSPAGQYLPTGGATTAQGSSSAPPAAASAVTINITNPQAFSNGATSGAVLPGGAQASPQQQLQDAYSQAQSALNKYMDLGRNLQMQAMAQHAPPQQPPMLPPPPMPMTGPTVMGQPPFPPGPQGGPPPFPPGPPMGPQAGPPPFPPGPPMGPPMMPPPGLPPEMMGPPPGMMLPPGMPPGMMPPPGMPPEMMMGPPPGMPPGIPMPPIPVGAPAGMMPPPPGMMPPPPGMMQPPPPGFGPPQSFNPGPMSLRDPNIGPQQMGLTNPASAPLGSPTPGMPQVDIADQSGQTPIDARLAAIEQMALSNNVDPASLNALVQNVSVDTSRFDENDARRAQAVDAKRASIYALSLLNGRQRAGQPVESMPGVQEMLSTYKRGESPEIQLAVINGLRSIPNSYQQSNQVRRIANEAAKSPDPRIQRAAQALKAGQPIAA